VGKHEDFFADLTDSAYRAKVVWLQDRAHHSQSADIADRAQPQFSGLARRESCSISAENWTPFSKRDWDYTSGKTAARRRESA